MDQIGVLDFGAIHDDPQLLVDLLLELHLLAGGAAEAGEVGLLVDAQIGEQFVTCAVFVLALH